MLQTVLGFQELKDVLGTYERSDGSDSERRRAVVCRSYVTLESDLFVGLAGWVLFCGARLSSPCVVQISRQPIQLQVALRNQLSCRCSPDVLPEVEGLRLRVWG